MKQNQTKQQATAKPKHGNTKTNIILEDHGDWLLIDISTPRHPAATMAVDRDILEAHDGGRIQASLTGRSKYIYAGYNSPNKTYSYLHKDIIDVPDGCEVDHVIHGTMTFIDNRASNIRVATRSQNVRNRATRSDNVSGLCGVYWDKRPKRWAAAIRFNKKHIYLGLFTDINDAIAARKAAEEKYFGEYAFKSGAAK